MTYWEKLKDPRWQKLRLKVMELAGWKCGTCGREDRSLNVHHRFYIKGREPWEYDLLELACLCESCHADEHHMREALAQTAFQANVTTDQMLGYVHGCALITNATPTLHFNERPRFGYLVGLSDVYRIDAERLSQMFDRRVIYSLTDTQLMEFAQGHDLDEAA